VPLSLEVGGETLPAQYSMVARVLSPGGATRLLAAHARAQRATKGRERGEEHRGDLVNSLDPDDQRALNRFREYVRIPSISQEGLSNGPYEACVQFLASYCSAIPGCTTERLYLQHKKPVLLATLAGQDSTLPCILLNSHYDVVPVTGQRWCCDPFGAEIRQGYDCGAAGSEDCVYGRGTQDVKSVSCQYLEALLRLRTEGWKPLRTIHLTFVPDEEIGGRDGMESFSRSKAFTKLGPIAFALDEGLASPGEKFVCFYGERIA